MRRDCNVGGAMPVPVVELEAGREIALYDELPLPLKRLVQNAPARLAIEPIHAFWKQAGDAAYPGVLHWLRNAFPAWRGDAS